MGSNPAKAGHYVTSVGKLFTPTVPSGAEGRLNQLTPGISSTSVATPGISFICVGSVLLSLNWWINWVPAGYGRSKVGRWCLCWVSGNCVIPCGMQAPVASSRCRLSRCWFKSVLIYDKNLWASWWCKSCLYTGWASWKCWSCERIIFSLCPTHSCHCHSFVDSILEQMTFSGW